MSISLSLASSARIAIGSSNHMAAGIGWTLTELVFSDRHDFTVVETIDFFDDEDDDLPAPMTQKDVVLLNRANAFRDEAGDADPADDQEDGPQDVEASSQLSKLSHHPEIMHMLVTLFCSSKKGRLDSPFPLSLILAW